MLPLHGTMFLPHRFQYVLLDPQLDLQLLDTVGSPINFHFLLKIQSHSRYSMCFFANLSLLFSLWITFSSCLGRREGYEGRLLHAKLVHCSFLIFLMFVDFRPGQYYKLSFIANHIILNFMFIVVFVG